MQLHQLQQPTAGMQMQHMSYNQQTPMYVNNPLPTNQLIDNTHCHQNEISNNSQTLVGQNSANFCTTTAYASLSEDEELNENTAEHNNNNPWQAVKKRKRASNKIPLAIYLRLDKINQFQELQVEENIGTEGNNNNLTVPETSQQQSKEPKPSSI
jgi:hypothetical protein